MRLYCAHQRRFSLSARYVFAVWCCRWRLVSAPSIPGLLSLDPHSDPTALLSSLTMGTEVEIQFGKSLQVSPCSHVVHYQFLIVSALSLLLCLQAAMARKLRDSDIATQWTLTYHLNSRLRMQFNISSSAPYPRTLIFQYSSDGVPRS